MSNYIDDIAVYLATQLTLAVGTDIFKGYMPPEPGDAIAIYPSGGRRDVVQGNPLYEILDMHITVRGTTFDLAMTKAEDVNTALHTLWEYTGTVTSKRYLYVKNVMSPMLLGYDYTDNPPRVMIAVDFEVTKDV